MPLQNLIKMRIDLISLNRDQIFLEVRQVIFFKLHIFLLFFLVKLFTVRLLVLGLDLFLTLDLIFLRLKLQF